MVTGRCGDPSLALAPLIHHYGWAEDDWARLALGSAVGHLLECGSQVTGGVYYDPGFKDIPDPANIGFPIAEVGADGRIVITKADATGGVVNLQVVKEQLLYEVHDPANYITPDVTLDFSGVTPARAGRRPRRSAGRARQAGAGAPEGHGLLRRRLAGRGRDLARRAELPRAREEHRPRCCSSACAGAS